MRGARIRLLRYGYQGQIIVQKSDMQPIALDIGERMMSRGCLLRGVEQHRLIAGRRGT